MDIKITVADGDTENLTTEQNDAYVAELRARIWEVYPDSNIVVAHGADVTGLTVDGFHDNHAVRVVVHELQQDVYLHGHWRKA